MGKPRNIQKRTAATLQEMNPQVVQDNFPPLTNGRKVVLGIVNSILCDPTNIRSLKQEMQDKFDAGPVEFYKEIVFPLMPKQLEVEGESGPQKAKLNIVLTTE